VTGIFADLPKGKVLDLGCGSGDYAQRLKESGFEVTASDMDVKRFNYHDTIEFKESHLDRPLPFGDQSFDHIIFLEVIEHIYNPDFVIREISRVLKPNGVLILSTPNILNIGSRLRFLFEGSFDFFREPILDYSKIFPMALQNMHVVAWRYQELEYLLFKNGISAQAVFTDFMKPALKWFGCIFVPLFKFQSWQKENRARKAGGVDFSRIHKILLSKEILYGRHLIIKAIKIDQK